MVVAAAGNNGRYLNLNEGYGTIVVPGNDPYVITVGDHDGTDTDAGRRPDCQLQFERSDHTRSYL